MYREDKVGCQPGDCSQRPVPYSASIEAAMGVKIAAPGLEKAVAGTSLLVRHPDDEIEVAHAVFPRTDYDPGRVGYPGMPWVSMYWLPQDKHPLQEGGFASWPFAVLRDMTSPGEVYGRSAALMVLSNIKVLNAQKRTLLQAAQKLVDPPLLASDDSVMALNQTPGAVNYGGLDSAGNQLVKPLITNAKLDIGLDMMDKEREIIGSAFLMDVFRVLVENPQMTATQTLELMQERSILMAPIGGRIESEGLGPMTERELDLLQVSGRLPEMPPELIEAEGEYRIEYTSPARRAQRASEGLAITRTLESITPLAQINPRVLQVFDEVEVARELAEINGVPEKVLRSREVIAQNTYGYPSMITTDPKSKFETPKLFESLGFKTYLKMSGFHYMVKGDVADVRMKLLAHIKILTKLCEIKQTWSILKLN
jgi:hypothetical protein